MVSIPPIKMGGLRDGFSLFMFILVLPTYIKISLQFFQLSVAGKCHRSGEGPQADSTHRSTRDAEWYTWFMGVDSPMVIATWWLISRLVSGLVHPSD